MRAEKNQPRPRMGAPGILAALDVGTAKTCCLIAKQEGQGQLRVLGAATQASSGIKNATIVDIDAAAHTIGSVVQRAESRAKQKIDGVITNLAGPHIFAERAQTSVRLGEGPIGTPALKQVIGLSRERTQQDGRHALHFLTLGYSVDQSRGVRDPRGMFGSLLELDTLHISTNSSVFRTLQTAIGRAHLDIDDNVVSPYASGLAVLHEDERDLGVTLIDIGAGSTDIAVFSDGVPVHCCSLPIGSGHITSDIARGLSTPLAFAERLKTLQGSCLASSSDEADLIDLEPIGEWRPGESSHVPRALLVRIIRARMEEIFDMAARSTASSDAHRLAGGAVVLTGGGAQLHGVAELASHILDKRTRIGRPVGVAGLGDHADDPAVSTAVGILQFAKKKMNGGLDNTCLNSSRHRT